MHHARENLQGSNKVIDVVFTYALPVVEPVTLAEVNAYMKVDYPDEDDLIEDDLIKEAREWVEVACGISVIARTVTAIISVLNRQELPYGPVASITNVKDATGTIITTGFTFEGTQFPRLLGSGLYKVTYQAGYAPLPKPLKIAIMARVLADYEHRGDVDAAGYSKIAWKHAKQYNRVLWV